MPDPNRTEIAVILDRSGSMEIIKDDMVGGFAAFVNEQRAAPGALRMSLYRFDDEVETVYEDREASEVGPLELLPRGSTALLDAVGKAIVCIGERLRKKPEAERPGVVIVLVITDGHENASREYDVAKVRQMIEHQERVYNWKFVYLGADAQGFAEARDQGFTRSLRYDEHSVREAYSGTSRSVRRYRKEVSLGHGAADLRLDPDDDEPGN